MESQCSLTGPSHGELCVWGACWPLQLQQLGQRSHLSHRGGGELCPVLAGPWPALVAVHSLSHDQPQQDQDPSPQGQAHHIAPGVICRAQEGTVTGGPWEEPPWELLDKRSPVGATWGTHGAPRANTCGQGGMLGSSWAKE